jgi:predicted amidophosphoribosyltransferase
MLRPVLHGLTELLLQPHCVVCGEVCDSKAQSADLCPECHRELMLPKQPIEGIWPMHWLAAGRYSGKLRTLMLRLRRSREQSLIRTLSSNLREALPAEAILITIPSWKPKHRSNPLPAMLATALDRPIAPLLRRSRAVVGQHHLNRDQRWQNQRQSFCFDTSSCTAKAIDLKQRQAWLVDDIMTTGATVMAASMTLEQEGIYVRGTACLARTPRKPPL